MTETLRFAAEALKTKYSTIRRMAFDGQLPGAFKIGKQWLLNKEVFLEWEGGLGKLKARCISAPAQQSGSSNTSTEMADRFDALLGKPTKEKPAKSSKLDLTPG